MSLLHNLLSTTMLRDDSLPEQWQLLAQEMEGSYQVPCTALIAQTDTEPLQLPCWIRADKKGASYLNSAAPFPS